MITGFNTDIEHEGVVYHVQTEDKGIETPLILSLVYDRGTILASKRSPYDDLIKNGFDEKILIERLQKQHKLMCAAVRAGRIEELKQMTAKAAAINKAVAATNKIAANKDFQTIPDGHSSARPIPKPAEIMRPAENKKIEPLPPKTGSLGKPSLSQELSSPLQAPRQESYAPAIPLPKEELIWDLPLKIVEADLIVETRSAAEETMIEEDAVEIVTELRRTRKPPPASLVIEFLIETTFKAGERKTLNIRVFRGRPENFVAAAQVMVKVLGSSFRPLIFHAKTDSNGIAVVHLQLPQFRAGRGAVLVRAIHAGEEAELRQIIRQG